jgi:hypothetical protein
MPHVKVVFESEGEIRRYLLPSGPGAFEELTNKVRGVLGPDVAFRIFWKDAEGDLVVCDSDVELQTATDSLAISGNPNDLLRLYARVRSLSSKTQRSAEQDAEMNETGGEEREKSQPGVSQGPKVHVGVSCDGCEGIVAGIRYKDMPFPFLFPWMKMTKGFGGKCGRGRHGCHRFPGMQGKGFMRQPGHGGCGRRFQTMGDEGQSNANADVSGSCGQTHNQQAQTVDQIAKSLEEMGIKADGGVIRELIEQFHGDIVKIIEAIN